MAKQLYLFSGLGADEKAFQRLKLDDFQVTHIRWIKPNRNEQIATYARRLLDQVIAPQPVLMGLSFGGIMAIEIAKHLVPEKIILISSVKTKKEIPLPYRVMGRMGLHKLFPVQAMKSPNLITNYLFGAHTEEDKQLLKPMLMNTDLDFVKWAMHAVAHWKNRIVPSNTFHIHGTGDKVLPFRNVTCNYTIEDGEHMMILNRADEMNGIIKSILKS